MQLPVNIHEGSTPAVDTFLQRRKLRQPARMMCSPLSLRALSRHRGRFTAMRCSYGNDPTRSKG